MKVLPCGRITFKTTRMTQNEIDSIAHELAFWQEFVKTPRFLNTWAASGVNPELLPEVVELLRPHAASKVLDVGSGVVSILHGLINEVVAVDPLAPLYDLIFDYSKSTARRPLGLRGEELDKHVHPGAFDVAHIRNALDHAQDPKKVIANMWAALKPGGLLIVHGFVDEATDMEWQGMHQWDIHPARGGMEVIGKDGFYFHLSGDVRVFELPTGRDWMLLTKTKQNAK